MANLLVTGGAGFIGAISCTTGCASTRATALVVLDALTYAGQSRQPRRGRRACQASTSSTATSATAIWWRQLLKQHAIDTIVHFAAESPRRSLDPRPRTTSCAPTSSAPPRCCEARAVWLERRRLREAGPLPPRLDRRGVRLAWAPTGRSRKTTPYAPNSPYAASKAASDHLVRAYHHTYGLPGHHHQLLQQLRTVPVPGEADPADDRERAGGRSRCRSTATARTCGIGCTWRTTAARSIASSSGPSRRDLQRGRAHRAGQPRPGPRPLRADRRGSSPRTHGCASGSRGSPAAAGKPTASLITFVKDRPGHDRRYAIDDAKLARGAGVLPAPVARLGPRAHRGVVSRITSPGGAR